MKVLAIGAHPDDIEIFMFGFLLICKLNDHNIEMTIATDGSLGGVTKDDNLSKKRKKETIRGLKLLGKPSFLDIPDGFLGNSSEHLKLIKKNIDKNQPDLVLTHYKKDYHSDHVALSKLVKKAVGHYRPILYCDTMMGINFNPSYYIDITTIYKDKVKAILEHKSQGPKRFVDLINLMNSFRAAQCNAPLGTYAEAYYFEKTFPFSDIRDLLPQSLKIRPFHIVNKKGFL